MLEEKELTEQELYEQELKQNPPKIITELERRPGEVDFSQLSDGDFRQLMTRYFNDMCAINKSTLQIVADLYVIIEIIAEQMGINVKAKKMELARKYKEQIDKNIEESKQNIKDSAKA